MVWSRIFFSLCESCLDLCLPRMFSVFVLILVFVNGCREKSIVKRWMNIILYNDQREISKKLWYTIFSKTKEAWTFCSLLAVDATDFTVAVGRLHGFNYHIICGNGDIIKTYKFFRFFKRLNYKLYWYEILITPDSGWKQFDSGAQYFVSKGENVGLG